MAQIERRAPQQYRIRIYLGKDESGKRTFRSETFHGPRRAPKGQPSAESRARELQDDFDKGLLRREAATLDDFLDRWLDLAKLRVSERTLENYTWLLKKYVRPHLGNRGLAEIEPLDIQACYGQMKGLSPRTIRYTHTVLGMALRQAVRWRLVKWDATDGVELPRSTRREKIRTFTESQVAGLLETARDVRYGPVFLLALTSGLRPEEYCALDWENVDLDAGTVKVTRALIVRHGWKGWKFGPPKSKRGYRTVPIPPETVEALKLHARNQQKERLQGKPRDLNLVFTNGDGNPISPANLNAKIFKPLLVHAGLPNTHTLYDCRHTWVTLALAGGLSPRLVSEWAGHASVAFTLDTYAHIIPSMEQQGSEQLKAIFAGILGTRKAQSPRQAPKRERKSDKYKG